MKIFIAFLICLTLTAGCVHHHKKDHKPVRSKYVPAKEQRPRIKPADLNHPLCNPILPQEVKKIEPIPEPIPVEPSPMPEEKKTENAWWFWD